MSPQPEPEFLIRRLPPEDWHLLGERYAAHGEALPPPESTTAVVAELAGKIVGMFGLNMLAHAGPMEVDADFRGHGVAQNMGAEIERLAAELGAKGLIMLPSTPESQAVAERLGFTRMPWSVYQKTF